LRWLPVVIRFERFTHFKPPALTEVTDLGSEDVKQLAVITPAIMGPAYFREAAEVIGAAAGGPPDRAKMTDVLRRHGMTVAAPPAPK
jgi:hypothetical protein